MHRSDYFFTLNNLILPALLLVFVFSVSFVLPVSAESGTTIRLTNNTDALSYRAQLSIQENDIFVVWQDDSAGDGDIFFSKGSTKNLDFEDTVNLSNNVGKSAFPRFTILDDKVFTTWYDYSPGTSDIYFARSLDGGKTFETFNLSQNDGVSYNPWVAASGNNVYVVWNDDTSSVKNLSRESINQTKYFDVSVANFEILFATSHDGGSSFEITNLSNTPGGSQNPRMAASGNNVYVIWTETEHPRNIFLAVSTDGGMSFNDPVNVSNSQNKSGYAAIQAEDNIIHVLWREKSTDAIDIFYARSGDNGITFGTPVKLSEGGIDLQLTRDTNMVVSKNEIFAVWYENDPTNSGVFFVKSIDGGKTFSRPINLSGPVDGDSYPQIAKYNKTIYIIWNDKIAGDSEVFLRKSTDGGETFSSIENLSNDFFESKIFVLGPQIVLTENDVFTIFEREDITYSNLYLNVFSQTQKAGTLLLQTINGAINVELDMGEKSLDIQTPANFAFKFFDPKTGEPLENVNYSFSIEDLEGNKIVNNQNQLAKEGIGTQNVQFSKPGPMTVIIDIEGIGNDPPYDTKFAGTTSAVITVVPEFPIGVLAVMISILSAVIIMSRIMAFKSSPKNTILKTI